MDNRKFEKLIDLIINENEEQARELFHEIVVDKSREIYESIMEEEMMDGEMGGQVGDLLDEINAEEEGMYEDDEEVEMDISDDDSEFSDEESFDFESDDIGDDSVDDEVEDAVIRIEDKLDQLMAEFESIMGGEGSDEEVDIDAEVEDDDSDEEVMEAVQLQKVSVTHGDNGVQNKSPVASNAGQAGIASRPVKSSTSTENGRTAPTTSNVKGAGSFKNAPGQKKQDLSSAPKPVTKQASDNTKSPVAK